MDEIGDLPTHVQAKLLRVLQEREFERVGPSLPISVDVRILAATHRDLERLLKAGQFRDDLYHRLNVVTIVLPPLRERRQDLPLFMDYLLRAFAEKTDRRLGDSPLRLVKLFYATATRETSGSSKTLLKGHR